MDEDGWIEWIGGNFGKIQVFCGEGWMNG